MLLAHCLLLILVSIAQAQDRDTLITVRRGDSLLGIAKRLLNHSHHYTAAELVGEIRRANGVQGDVIYPGQRLVVALSFG